jgi:N-acetylglucosaminyldiphosphoundecaprenol N-acetyl-beta-D-mannosaminyltransferase
MTLGDRDTRIVRCGEQEATMTTATSSANGSPKAVSILGVEVVPFESYAEAVKCAEEAIVSRRKTFWVAINPEKIETALGDARLRSVLAEADVGLCDGIGVAIAARLLHGVTLRRCTGCDLFFHLMARVAEKGWKVFLLGASPASNERACARLAERFAGLNIVGRRDGYFEDSSAVVSEINASQADALFVAMGSPRQEYWIAEHREALHPPFCMGVGGSFDIASGEAPRAPRFFQKTGMEYFYQVIFRPGWSAGVRWQRTLSRLSFMMAVLRETMAGRGHRCRTVASASHAGSGGKHA